MENTILLLLILIIIISIIFVLLKIYSKSDIINLSKIGSHEDNSKSIVWENKQIYSDDKLIQISELIENTIKNYEPVNSKNSEYLLKTISESNNISLDGVISLRNMIATQKSINSFKKINVNKINNVVNDYKLLSNLTNQNVKQFFKKYDIPPLKIINILKDNGLKINQKLYQYAEKNDSENQKSMNIILKNADDFEKNLINWIKVKYPSIKFKTQEQLVEEQTKLYGKPFATPDILFDEPILITVSDNKSEITQLIKWIDAKNYTLMHIPFIMNSLKNQSEKYLQHFGPGAFAFHYGINKNINIPNILILDASFIN